MSSFSSGCSFEEPASETAIMLTEPPDAVTSLAFLQSQSQRKSSVMSVFTAFSKQLLSTHYVLRIFGAHERTMSMTREAPVIVIGEDWDTTRKTKATAGQWSDGVK